MKKLFYYYLCSKIMTDKEKIAELESQLADALAKIAELSAELTTALEKISELESLLSKFMQKKTSKNSHVPPSSDLSRKNQSLREKSNKPVGVRLVQTKEAGESVSQLLPISGGKYVF